MSINRDKFIRILLLGCINIILTLPFGLLSLIPEIVDLIRFKRPFYEGWDTIHSNWAPYTVSYADELTNVDITAKVEDYAGAIYPIVLSFVIFALFGLTEDARATYRKGFVYVANIFGWRIKPRNRSNARISTIVFRGDHEIGPEIDIHCVQAIVI
jgi:hypothetical protein